MKPRVAAIAFLLASASTALTGFLILPTLVRLLGGKGELLLDPWLAQWLRSMVPWALTFEFFAILLLSWVVLLLTVGRPLTQTEELIEQIGRLDLDTPFGRSAGGPLTARIQASLRRMVD